ncbi:MAG TPA: helix-turn-helix transcriptional regulator [Hymenobacter sp.]
MSQDAIGQRIKFLIDSLKISVRKFAQSLDVAETNIRNYIDKGSKPSSEALERIVRAFPQTNLVWLVTGDGEPFLKQVDEPLINYQKNNSGNTIGNNRGIANQQQGSGPSPNEAALLREIELLREQLKMKDTVIAAKDESIALLKAAYKRPN